MMKKKILIVSQENYIGELLRAELMEEGYETSLANTSEKAFSKYRLDFPDLVLIDTVLSEIDCADVLRCFHEGNASPPVVIWSAYDTGSDENPWWVSEAYVMNTASFFKIKKKIKELCPCH